MASRERGQARCRALQVLLVLLKKNGTASGLTRWSRLVCSFAVSRGNELTPRTTAVLGLNYLFCLCFVVYLFLLFQ
jgi:hypothetical protein